ncbi:hypothetical protein V5799_001485 [Amblyomma americanum]|uniref:Uncharacterized protein n=1 Tax=Amblyomma americanum TaxID=6943 RepID=A0AAQ4D023_AMBAM
MVRVVGSGWRPTRFVEAVPPHRVCNLCRILPESNVLLPCHHVLCDSCHAGCQVRENGGVCALDGIPFSLQECRKNQLPTSTAETVGAHCWNEVQGCGFVGKLGDMLRHYEQDCAFHAVLCPRCGNWVRRCNMPNHYAAGCPPAGPAARASEPPSRPTVVDVTSVLRQFMTHVKAQDQMLPSLQSTLNTLHEKAGIHSARLEQVAGDVRESEQRLKHDLARTAEHLATKIARDVKVHQRDSNQTKNVGNVDATVGDGNDTKLSTCWRAEKRHILHKLELAADDSMSCLRDIRHCMTRLLHGRQLADDPGCEALAGVHYMSTWVGGKDSALYRLCVTGAESLLTSSAVYPGLFSSAKVWYSRSAYFVAVLGTTKWEDKLDLYFRNLQPNARTVVYRRLTEIGGCLSSHSSLTAVSSVSQRSRKNEAMAE